MNISFEMSSAVRSQIALIDVVLSRLGQPPCFDNDDFSLNADLAGTNYRVIRLRRAGAATIDFFLSGAGMRVDLDEIPETFEWSLQQIQDQSKMVTDFIYDLLRSFILVEKSGRAIEVRFFDLSGIETERITVRQFGYLKGRDGKVDRSQIYLPAYYEKL